MGRILAWSIWGPAFVLLPCGLAYITEQIVGPQRIEPLFAIIAGIFVWWAGYMAIIVKFEGVDPKDISASLQNPDNWH